MRYIFILVALLCVSCGTALPSIKPYKLDIQQGNVVTSKMLLQLRPGMTKSQVRFIMGTPLVQDSFHGKRWDYVYQMREAGKIKEQRRVILDFENELLKSVRGDVIAAGSEQTKDAETPVQTGTRVVTPIKAQEEKGLLDKLKFWENDSKAADKEAVKETAADKLEREKAAKAKAEAEQAVKNVAPAPEPALQEKTAPVANESASLLAVPIELGDNAKAKVPAVDAVPNLDVTQAVMPPVEASQPATAVPEVAPAVIPVQTTPDAQASVTSPATPLSEQGPKNPHRYESPAGMQFDRNIRIEDEEPVPAVEPSGARSGNKMAPIPKTLPQEKDPSFFDRMLEQIGF
jgi:outer membrane protein assembly factor BamE